MNLSEKAAQGQLDAYNQRDIESFIQWYAEDVIAYDLDQDKCLFQGLEALRDRYVILFENSHLACTLKNRMVAGSTVIDHESVRLGENLDPIEVIAIYEVNQQGLIKTIRFTRGNL